jgi:transposase
MASLQRNVVRGRTYWRIVESRRVNGKPRPVPIMHLGTVDNLLQRLLEAPAGRLRLQSFQHGDVAALKAAADRLGVVAIVNKHVPSRRRGLSVGTTLLLAALNRAAQPRSKRAWARWAAQTSVHRLFPGLRVRTLTSQYFWDQMDCVSLESLRAIEDELTRRVVGELGITLDTLFYDTTNFFTYIASTNEHTELAQRGHSKQKRYDLRLFGLALLASRDGQIPLCSQVYEGNRVDVQVFPTMLSDMRQRLAQLAVDIQDLTIVYDKGNLSKANQALVDDSELGYVASLTPAHHADLMAVDRGQYAQLPADSALAGLPVLRLQREIWGAERTVVLFISQQLRDGQIRGLQQHLTKRLAALAEWQQQLAKPRSGPRSSVSAQKRIAELLGGQYVNQVLRVTYHSERQGAERLDYWVDGEALEHLQTEVFGKRILITNRHAWSTEEIIQAYQGQSEVEAIFRQCKDDEHLAVRPQYHWTDQKIQVHAFVCLLALLLARVVEREARQLGHGESLSSLLDLLGTVRLVLVIHASTKNGGRPRADWQLEQMDASVAQLFRRLVPERPPFVYTDGSA